jgi:SAM-dependent methyltransferase
MKDSVYQTGERISPEADHNSYIEQLSIYNFFCNQINQTKHEVFSLVDCASGTGYGLEYLISKTKLKKENSVGIDISEEAVSFSKNKYPDLNYEVGDILDIKQKNIDIFTCNQTLEHFYKEDQVKVIESIYNTLSKNGVAMIGVPNKPVYQKFDPNNKFHLNELDFENFKKTIETKKWSSVEYFLQLTPSYQESALRKNKIVKFTLSLLPVKVIYFLANILNPKINISDLIINSFKESDLVNAKCLIAICKK